MKLDQKQLSSLIDRVARAAIRETLSPILEDEREKQKELTQNLKDLKASQKKSKKTDEDLEEAEDEGDDKESETGESLKAPAPEKPRVVSRKLATGKAEPEAPKAIMPNPADIKDVTFDQVITLMNMMRSGKSTKDPRTKDSLGSYFKGLNAGEKQALFVLLSGITQILAGGVEGDAAPDPSEVGIRIKPKAAEHDATAPSQGAPTKPVPGKPSPSKLQPGEPVPIVVGEASNRHRERAVLENLRTSLRGKR